MPRSPRADIRSRPRWSRERLCARPACCGEVVAPSPASLGVQQSFACCVVLPESTVLVHCFLLPGTLIASEAALFDPLKDAVLGSV